MMTLVEIDRLAGCATGANWFVKRYHMRGGGTLTFNVSSQRDFGACAINAYQLT